MTEKEIGTIWEGLAEGKSLRRLCRELGHAESSVRRWLNEDEDIFASIQRARELGCDAMADECIEIADGTEPSDVKRIRIETRIRLIGKWSQRYSDKVTVKSESTVTHRHDLRQLNDADLDAVERILANASTGEGGESPAIAPRLH